MMDQAEWTAAHVEAFAFFGGVPARLVPDNLKTGVDRPDLYDPKINRAYAELAAHYGTLVDPARALKPKDKPQVERPMPYVRDSFWRGREFTSLERDARRRGGLEQRGGRRTGRVARWTGRPRPRCSPRSRQRALAAVAGGAVRAGHLVEREGRPGHPRQGRRHPLLAAVAATSANASTPGPRPTMVQFFHHGELIKTHPRKDRGKQTDLRRLPAGEDRLPHAHPDLVPPPGRRGRPGLRGRDRRTAGRERAVPAARRPRRARAGRQARPRPGSRPPARRPPRPETRPTAPSRASSPPAPRPTAPPARPGTPAPPAHLHGPDQLFADPHRIPADRPADRRRDHPARPARADPRTPPLNPDTSTPPADQQRPREHRRLCRSRSTETPSSCSSCAPCPGRSAADPDPATPAVRPSGRALPGSQGRAVRPDRRRSTPASSP